MCKHRPPIAGVCIHYCVAARLAGARFVPLTLADQRLIVKAVQDTLAKVGPVELLNYRCSGRQAGGRPAAAQDESAGPHPRPWLWLYP